MIALTSRGIAKVPHLTSFLGDEVALMRNGSAGFTAVAGWGAKRSGLRARAAASTAGVPCLLLEDGFLRSVGRGDAPLSLVVDDVGIYYKAGSPSRLEALIAAPLGEEQAVRARTLAAAWRQGRVSKYNYARDYDRKLPQRFVLVVDQTYGDSSVQQGSADDSSFERMLKAALNENPDCTVVVKTHPDVFTRKKRGYFDFIEVSRNQRISVVAEDCHPARLLEEAEVVYTVTSQMGFEAILWGKPVRCFGMPFYAGWGLTNDELDAPSRRRPVSLEALVHAALVAYPRYVDPETGHRCEVERIIEHIALQRRMQARFPRKIHAIGFSRWKKPILQRFMAGSEIRFERRAGQIPGGATVAVWGSSTPAGLPLDAKLIRVEDGFLRSVGLGADLIQPLSWVCDDEGLYYDSSRPSRLERVLTESDFSQQLLARARSLRDSVVAAKVTKYNVSAVSWTRPEIDKPVILVPGQVESDASIRFGAPATKTNLDLLRAVRAAHPDAYLVYKPHPDVIAGLRAKGKDEDEAASLCDEIVTRADMAQMLDQVDEVHTLTSLTGFEALLRGVPVTCYGQPFYAGWGLTNDMVPVERRLRRLSLDELIAGCLILYPSYVSRVTGQFTTPERAVNELVTWRVAGNKPLPLWRRTLRPALRFFVQLRRSSHSSPQPRKSVMTTIDSMEASRGGR
ncbi:capsular polysaccharide biosynthesis protein [Microvirga pakistanensis]|uniref:capsular polysaccharide biosynthesis protein n=1 Tax=Microvirga pakistanensis TaxID=1682650 RepID=UPI00106A9830|nr:capsular polysaccharide biosynthesis protein [Microvirga pakistanensis]